MTEYLISQGKELIIVGRHTLDTGDISSIPSFVKQVTHDHPEVERLINNAGVQRPLYINTFDLTKADQEININLRGSMHLAINLLPHLKGLTLRPAVMMNISSVLDYILAFIINLVYNSIKA